jgi:hypothetical protein
MKYTAFIHVLLEHKYQVLLLLVEYLGAGLAKSNFLVVASTYNYYRYQAEVRCRTFVGTSTGSPSSTW